MSSHTRRHTGSCCRPPISFAGSLAELLVALLAQTAPIPFSTSPRPRGPNCQLLPHRDQCRFLSSLHLASSNRLYPPCRELASSFTGITSLVPWNVKAVQPRRWFRWQQWLPTPLPIWIWKHACFNHAPLAWYVFDLWMASKSVSSLPFPSTIPQF